MFIQSIYDISNMGFIPSKCEELPKEFQFLEKIYLGKEKVKNFREFVNYMEFEFPDDLDNFSYEEIKTIYTLSGILSHYYIWCGEPTDVLPIILSWPWWHSSLKLGIKPVLTHAAVNLWNWKLKDEKEIFSLDNLETKYYMTNSKEVQKTEAWFYLIMSAIEGECGKIIFYMDNIYSELESGIPDEDIVFNNLKKIDSILGNQILLINRIYEKCKPELFYYKLRNYLNGSSKLKNGLILDGIDTEPIFFKGGSAAQSSIVPCENIFFNVQHPQKNIQEFLEEMRGYMPEKHRNLLIYFIKRPKLEEYLDYFKNPDISILYKICINKLMKFRFCHMNIVKKYVFDQQGNMKGTGTGGTPLNSFLQTIIQNTVDTYNKNYIYTNPAFIALFMFGFIICMRFLLVMLIYYFKEE